MSGLIRYVAVIQQNHYRQWQEVDQSSIRRARAILKKLGLNHDRRVENHDREKSILEHGYNKVKEWDYRLQNGFGKFFWFFHNFSQISSSFPAIYPKNSRQICIGDKHQNLPTLNKSR